MGLYRAVDQLYAAALDGTLWASALRDTAALLGGDAITLEVHSKPDRGVEFFTGLGLHPEGPGQYAEYFHRVCPRFGPIMSAAPGDIQYDYFAHTEADLLASEFYTDFLLPKDLKYYVSCTLENSRERVSFFSVQRNPRQGHVDTHELELARRLFPHMRRAVMVAQRLDQAERQLSLTGALELGILVVDGTGRILRRNDAADAILSASGPISAAQGTLAVAGNPTAALRLRRMIAAAARVAGGDLDADIGHLSLPAAAEGGASAISIVVTPMTRQAELPVVGELPEHRIPRALVVLHPERSSTPSWHRELSTRFGLTPTELELALALLHGDSLSEFGDRRGIAASTVKTHWKHVRQKVGCRSQGDLIRLLANAFPPMDRNKLL